MINLKAQRHISRIHSLLDIEPRTGLVIKLFWSR